MSKKKEVLGINGLDHGLWTLFAMAIGHIITYFTYPAFMLIVLDDIFIGMMLFWFYTEYKQEKVMVDDGRHEAGRHKKPWTWSRARWEDMGIPFVLGGIYLIIVHFII